LIITTSIKTNSSIQKHFRLYYLAFTFLFIGAVIFTLNKYSFIPTNSNITLEALLLFNSIQMLIFTLALSLGIYSKLKLQSQDSNKIKTLKEKVLNTPITQLIQHLDQLRDEVSKEELNLTVKNSLSIQMKKLKRLDSLNKIKSNNSSKDATPFFLSEIVEECRQQEGIDKNRFNFINESNNTFNLSKSEIIILFTELLNNANRHSSQGLIEARCTNPNDFFQINIHNQGAGFSKAILQKHPSLFFQQEQKGTQKTLGIGLYTCTELLQKHLGSCKIENISTGALVICRIPKP
jgi:signal transduction histidine kinase